MRLKGKVSVITGASRGIGRAIALTFAKEGSDVVVNYSKSREEAVEVVDEIAKTGRRAIAVQADVANKDEVLELVGATMKEFGKIDVLVNNAGIMVRRNLLEARKEEWESVFGVNIFGNFYCTQAVAPYMIKQRYGKIVNTASISGIGTVSAEDVIYAPSKAAVIAFTRKLAYELGPYNINVNAIAPGSIMTEMQNVGRTEDEVKRFIDERTRLSALGRVGFPQDVANAALFLACDESSFVTGQVLVVDGGRSDFSTHSV